ncbi:MAG: DNA adenine methylase [Lachnospiraceae bacterium]|nr:DNA adenine methylase [Lachnospiraceae bacterium]
MNYQIASQFGKSLNDFMMITNLYPQAGAVELPGWRELGNTLMTVSHGVETYNSTNAATELEQIVMWPGGKKKELKYIIQNLPTYENYYEPFCGGGSVFMGLRAKKHYINDFSTDLISLYKFIQEENQDFFNYVNDIEKTWQKAKAFADAHQTSLYGIFEIFFDNKVSDKKMKDMVSVFCGEHNAEIAEIISEFPEMSSVLKSEIIKYLSRRMRSMKKKGYRTLEGFQMNLETAIKGSLYIVYRKLYNDPTITKTNNHLHAATFLFIRQTAFGGKFSYNKKDEFNEGYGGNSCNKTTLANKLAYYQSSQLREHFSETHIWNMDFEQFLRETKPSANDFVFLDPPYDSPFSDYDGHEFNRTDHTRLANYLINECEAKWMMIIGATDFIRNLYSQQGIFIQEYAKVYTGNMKDNNDRNATHLLITNYSIQAETQSMEVSGTPNIGCRGRLSRNRELCNVNNKNIIFNNLNTKDMAKSKVFNPAVFNTQVKDLKETVGYIITNAEAKNVITQVVRDHRYDADEVLSYLHEITVAEYPDYQSNLQNSNWKKICITYAEMDKDVAPQLEGLLDKSIGGKWGNSLYQDQFFNVMKEAGRNIETMKTDMSLDYFGWLLTLNVILNKCGDSLREVPKCKEKTSKKSGKKSKGKIGKPLCQLSLTGELIKTYASVSEAVAALDSESDRTHNAGTIYQARSTGGTAYGYKWKYAEDAEGKSETGHVSEETPATIEDTPTIPSVENAEKPAKGGKTTKPCLVAYQLTPDKKFDKTKELGRFSTQAEICSHFKISKSTLSNYMKGRKASMKCVIDGVKARFGVERIAA